MCVCAYTTLCLLTVATTCISTSTYTTPARVRGSTGLTAHLCLHSPLLAHSRVNATLS